MILHELHIYSTSVQKFPTTGSFVLSAKNFLTSMGVNLQIYAAYNSPIKSPFLTL